MIRLVTWARLLDRFRSDSRAVAAVEFAVIAPILIILFTVAFDLARAVDQATRLEAALRAGGQYAIANPSATAAQIQSAIAADLALSPSISVTPSVSVIYCVCLGTNGDISDSTIPSLAATCTNGTCTSGIARFRQLSITDAPFTPLLTSAVLPLNYIGARTRSAWVRL